MSPTPGEVETGAVGAPPCSHSSARDRRPSWPPARGEQWAPAAAPTPPISVSPPVRQISAIRNPQSKIQNPHAPPVRGTDILPRLRLNRPISSPPKERQSKKNAPLPRAPKARDRGWHTPASTANRWLTRGQYNGPQGRSQEKITANRINNHSAEEAMVPRKVRRADRAASRQLGCRYRYCRRSKRARR